jgi:hypothetical protein
MLCCSTDALVCHRPLEQDVIGPNCQHLDLVLKIKVVLSRGESKYALGLQETLSMREELNREDEHIAVSFLDVRALLDQ